MFMNNICFERKIEMKESLKTVHNCFVSYCLTEKFYASFEEN